ncbi:MAG: TonB-dependent receptor [Candidatus Neomarinimicrobiota bacterium]|nr:TonB-dependent receptor [Candidatus Neomarinimicrobiota bacterium]
MTQTYLTKRNLTLITFIFFSILFSDTFRGKVIDEGGNPISNVNIYSDINGTTSDENGDYNWELKNNYEITFSHIGFEEIQIKPENLNKIIVLKESSLLGRNITVNSSLDNRDLYNTPSSVTLITSNHLSFRANNHFEGLTEQVSNLNYSSGTSRPRYFQIRGIGERSHYAGEGPPNYSVGFILDGLDFSGIGMVGHLFDLRQIEIFKGPQSTVFGPNAMAGSINISTNNPTPFYTGKLETYFSSDNRKTYSGAIGGPLVKSVSFRLSGTKHSQDGYRKNTFLNKKNTNGKDETLTRAKLLWQPVNDFSISLLNLNSNINNKYDAWAPDNNEELDTYTNDQGMDSQKSNAYLLKIKLPEFRGLETKFKFSKITSDLLHSYDGDWANNEYWSEYHGWDPSVEGYNYEFWDQTNREKTQNTSEYIINTTENLVLPFKSLLNVGLFYSNISQIDTATGYLFGGDATDLNSKFDIENTAIYSKISSKLSNNFELNFSLRSEKYTIDYFANGGYYGYPINAVDTSKTYDFFGTNFSLKYQINEDLLLYSSVSRGYKAGGINQHPSLNSISRVYDPEYNTNFELGGRLSNDKFKLNFAFFKMNRTDLQVQISSQQDESNPNSFTFYTSNASTGSNSGFEIELFSKITQNLKLNYSIGLLDTKVDEFLYPTGLDSLGELIYQSGGNRELAMAPNFTSSLNVNYTHKSGLFLNGNITSKDEYYFSDSHDQISNPYSLLNLDIGYRKNNLTLSLWGRNITDERYAVRGFYFGLEPPNYEDKLYLSYGNPKEVGLKVSYQF